MTSVEIVIPVLNEEAALPRCVARLVGFLESDACPRWDWRITIADNGSTDRTPEVGAELSEANPGVAVTRLEQRGRGRALKLAWTASEADVRCFMDVDLSTGLDALPALVAAITDEGYGLAIGSRLMPDSTVVGRTLKREITSRGYNVLIRMLFPRKTFRDAQCGFKAVSSDVCRDVLPLVENTGWFFDTELLLLSLRAGYSIKEIPVHWEDDPDTRVRIISTAMEDVRGLLRVRFRAPKPSRRV